MIALSHRTRTCHVVRVASEQDAAELFDLAQMGDTLHVVPAGLGVDTLMNQIESQLRNGQCKVLT